jgi:hypothetical protein
MKAWLAEAQRRNKGQEHVSIQASKERKMADQSLTIARR